MPAYSFPGLYLEEIPSGSKPIEGVGTSTAAFVGFTTKGPIGEPEIVLKWDDYDRQYGGIRDSEETKGDPMGFSVAAFFQNGGGKAYIVRITKDWNKDDEPIAFDARKAVGYLDIPSKTVDHGLQFSAVNEGAWANGLVVRMARNTIRTNLYGVEIGRKNDAGELEAQERYRNVSMDPKDPLFIKNVINDVSELVTVDMVPVAGKPITSSAFEGKTVSGRQSEDSLSGGADGSPPLTDDYIDIFTKFINYRDINIICLPGQFWAKDGTGNPVIDAAIGHASRMKSRMVIVDPPVSTKLETAKAVDDLSLPSKACSVMYYPWVKVTNPFYNAETNPGAPKTVLVPPSGYAAGMWAKIDGKRGVWKAPAGLESALLGVAGLQYIVEDGEQDALNPLGVNCLRKMPGAGHVIWGARTLATKIDPDWRYVPVRRTAIMIEQSITNGIQWAVFEPNDHRLWAALQGIIGGFMNSLFRVGAFQGEKASDAYFVRCGLGDTMTQTDIDAGQVIVIAGFAPLKPAEFVIVRIQQKVNQQ